MNFSPEAKSPSSKTGSTLRATCAQRRSYTLAPCSTPHVINKPVTTNTIPHDHTERELAVLQVVHENNTTPQRDIAQRTGMSLGMTNAILKRLAQKGFVTMRKVKGRHMAYAVTPDGVHEIARRTYRYFRRTMQNVTQYKEAVDALIADAASNGVTEVVLVGESDIAFIVEYACAAAEVGFQRKSKGDDESPAATTPDSVAALVLLGERDWGGGAIVATNREDATVRSRSASTLRLWDVIEAVEHGITPVSFGGYKS